MTAPASVSQRTIAKHWGCSQPYVAKCIKAGCPTGSLEAADNWRAANSERGAGYRSKPAITPKAKPAKPAEQKPLKKAAPEAAPTLPEEAASTDAEQALPPGLPAPARLDTLRASLQASIDIESEAHRLVRYAIANPLDPMEAAKLPILLATYNKAKEGRMQSEKMVKVLEREAGITITLDQAREICVRAWAPLVTRLRSAPRRAGIKANPVDDVLAEKVFSAEIEDALKEAQKVFPFPDISAAKN